MKLFYHELSDVLSVQAFLYRVRGNVQVVDGLLMWDMEAFAGLSHATPGCVVFVTYPEIEYVVIGWRHLTHESWCRFCRFEEMTKRGGLLDVLSNMGRASHESRAECVVMCRGVVDEHVLLALPEFCLRRENEGIACRPAIRALAEPSPSTISHQRPPLVPLGRPSTTATTTTTCRPLYPADRHSRPLHIH